MVSDVPETLHGVLVKTQKALVRHMRLLHLENMENETGQDIKRECSVHSRCHDK